MSTATPLGEARYRHRESMPFVPKPPPRARTLDAARVARIIDREVDKALRPLQVELRRCERTLDAIGATNAATEAKLSSVASLKAMRDNIALGRRCPTPAKVNAAIRARYGRDAEGRRPGELGFGLDAGAMRDAAVGAPSLAAAVNAANRKLWGRP